MENKTERIIIKNFINKTLGFRDSAVYLFKEINKLEVENVELDFKGVEFMSRSFAHEYLTQKSRSTKNIIEKNQKPSIERMLDAVENSFNRPNKIKVHPVKESPLILI
ncbi:MULTISPECIES: STAS-like domain-containing protein [Methanothermobacter]|uniref:STAS-like domain-containing protein n=1 Tax=Methanothermobacter wolfeii TaxID=145261 RepID=A0A9E7RSP0_METWO|nr:DUF4325 domain-containing protein [Methanothermobacter wolfeii]NP_071812.1 hypothetical protein psiM100p11 [Methanothermobacter phage psiM100]AAG39951.1 unknown [Methanothermobacter phage psiM100]UXH31524.1 STAS-like domain-containing protein [Methanothermobacter wolfeii]